MCREMAELGLDVARHAAAAARQEWADPEPPEPAPTRPAPVARETPARAPQPNTPRHEAPSPSLAFAHIVNAIRQVIALEAAIAATHHAAIEKAAQRQQDRAYRHAHPRTTSATPSETVPSLPTKPAAIPSLLANISREIGIDLEGPTLADRLPTFLRQTEPTGPPG